MPQIQPTTTITIDDATFEVANMNANIQQMVQYLDDWRQKEADCTSDLLMVRGALRDLQNTLLQAIQAEQAASTADPVIESEETPEADSEPSSKDDIAE